MEIWRLATCGHGLHRSSSTEKQQFVTAKHLLIAYILGNISTNIINKTSPVVDINDRFVTTDMGRKVRAVVPLAAGESWVPI